MRKLLKASAVIALPFLGGGAAFAAPSDQICSDSNARNCFKDEIFLLDGNSTVDRDGQSIPIVGCATSTDCYLTKTSELFSQVGLQDVVGKALELIRAKSPTLPAWDEVVVFTADFGPTRQPGPLFFRAADADGTPVNRIAHIGTGDLVEPVADRPYLGVIDGGNLKVVGTTPWTSKYAPCGTAPRYATDPPSSQPNGALCAPGVHTYFDALAQATAALYGPHLLGPDATTPLVAPPVIKTALVDAMGMSKFPGSGLSVDTWNALLDTRGSLLGGNTWRNEGTGALTAGRPPADFDASAPYEGTQIVRFTPMDLYLLGFVPSSAVPSLRSFAKGQPGDFLTPAITSFNGTAGPNMGTRLGNVTLRTRTGVPTDISFADILAANGGERAPGVGEAPQHLRQLWILVTKPTFLVDKIAGEEATKAGAASTAADDSKTAQAKEQTTEIDNLQRFRRAWGPYFYMLAGYTGRVVSAYEGNVEDMAYWEFADTADDMKAVSASGLDMEMRGSELVANGGGKKQTLLTIKHTPGNAGTLVFNGPPSLGLRIQGSAAASTAPNNVFTIRMRVPRDPGMLGKAKGHVVLSGPSGEYQFDFPKEGNLVPDGTFRSYTVLLSQAIEVDSSATDPDTGAHLEKLKNTEVKDFTGKTYDRITVTPSTVEMSGIDIELVRLGNSTTATDVDRDCDGHYRLDGWLGAEDNCPDVYNPDQADGNGDGVGDACEDYDGDSVVNACDDCAAVGGTGSACLGKKQGLGASCGIDPSSGGRPSSSTVVWSLLILGAAITLRRLRRQSRRK